MTDLEQGSWAEQAGGLYFSGAVNFSNLVSLEQTAKHWLERQTQQTCTLDLSGMQHCNSAGVALLLALLRAAQNHQKQLKILNPTQNLLSLIRLSSLDALLTETK